MSTPKGMKCVPRTLATGDKVHIYSDADRIVLQLRHLAPEESLLEPSFKSAESLTPAEALAIASDLLNAALPQLAALRAAAKADEQKEKPIDQ